MKSDLVERVAKAIMFADCGNTEHWEGATDLAEAAIRVCDARNPPRCSYCQASTSIAAPVQAAPTEPRIDPLQNPMRPGYFMNYAEDETPAEMVLRKLACWLGVGGFNAPKVDADLFHKRIVEAIQSLATPAPVAADTLRDALQRIASFKLSQFMGPHDMAMECVHAASAALAKQPEPTEPSDCDSCEGTGSGGMGVGCTDCLGTGIDPHASPAPVAAESCVPTALDSLLVTREELQVLEFRPAEFATPARAAEPQEQAMGVVQEAPLYSTRAKARRYEWLRDQSGADVRSLLGVGDLTSLDSFIDEKIAARNAQGETKP